MEYGEKRREGKQQKNTEGNTPLIPSPPKLQRAAPTETLTGIVIDKRHQHCQNPTNTDPYVFVRECVSVYDLISTDVPLRSRIVMMPRKTALEVTRGAPQPGAYLQRDRGQKTNDPEIAQATPNHR